MEYSPPTTSRPSKLALELRQKNKDKPVEQKPKVMSKYKRCLVQYLFNSGYTDSKKMTTKQIRDTFLRIRPDLRSIPERLFIARAGAIIFDESFKDIQNKTPITYMVSYKSEPDKVKIGHSTNIRNRLDTLETSHWDDLIIRFLFHNKGREQERHLHKLYKPYRIRLDREWFRVEGNLKSFLQNKPSVTITELYQEPTVYLKFDENQPVPEGEGA